ncbi:hypothetical protein BC835DRAFT_1302457 [Cytidiella melzeri]|nr:hypothetical protein BC835DRAFT_1302457 [Cytidiella melzeri]
MSRIWQLGLPAQAHRAGPDGTFADAGACAFAVPETLYAHHAGADSDSSDGRQPPSTACAARKAIADREPLSMPSGLARTNSAWEHRVAFHGKKDNQLSILDDVDKPAMHRQATLSTLIQAEICRKLISEHARRCNVDQKRSYLDCGNYGIATSAKEMAYLPDHAAHVSSLRVTVFKLNSKASQASGIKTSVAAVARGPDWCLQALWALRLSNASFESCTLTNKLRWETGKAGWKFALGAWWQIRRVDKRKCLQLVRLHVRNVRSHIASARSLVAPLPGKRAGKAAQPSGVMSWE